MTWALDYLVLKDAVYESYVICAVLLGYGYDVLREREFVCPKYDE